MRLWSLHPGHLDRQGLTACWRESLLAQAVLADRTRGYRHHPQLLRFRAQPDPLAAVGAYLVGVHAEATVRGYSYDVTKVLRPSGDVPLIEVTDGQLRHEWQHLMLKLRARSAQWAERMQEVGRPEPHPLFHVVEGAIAPWEVA